MISLQEIPQLARRVAELLRFGQEHDPEVVMLGPVEPGAVHDQDVLLMKEIPSL